MRPLSELHHRLWSHHWSLRFITLAQHHKGRTRLCSHDVGSQNKQVGQSQFGERLELPLRGEGQAICPQTDTVYQLTSSGISTIAEAEP